MSGFGSSPFAADTYGGSGDSSAPPIIAEVESGMSAADGLETEAQTVGRSVLTAADLVEARELLNAVSRAAMSDSVAVSSTLLAAVADSLKLDDKLKLVLEAVISDQATLAALCAGDRLVTTAVVDALLLSRSVETSVAAMAVLSDALALQDVLRLVQEGEVEDAVDVATALEVLVRALESVVSEAVFADDVAGLAIVSVLVPEVFELGSDPQAIALRLAAVEDGLDFAVSFAFDGEPYFAISMNAANRGVTEYVNFEFNSVATFNETLYGASDAGLYRHGGDTDAGVPIAAYLRTVMQRLAQGQVPGVSDAYLGFRGDGQLQLKVVVRAPRGGEQKGYVFDLIQSPADAPLPGRFKIGKGLQSVYMAFELGNVAGSDFAIDVMEIRPLVSYRRLP